jgi:hypothetical protein
MSPVTARLAALLAALAPVVAAAADPPAPAAAAPPVVAAPPTAAATPAPAQAAQRLDLDTTSIRGNQELPKVLYIVPWKEPGLAEPAGRPLNSLVDEALSPVDRDVFRRQMAFFGQLYARPGGASGEGAPGSANQ